MREQAVYIRNLIIRIILLAALFAACVVLFSRQINQVTPDSAQAMTDATFPLVNMQKDGVDFNLLHGYSREIDVSQMRDSITPLTDKRGLTLVVQTFGAAIDSVSYEVLTIDGTRSLENTKVIKLTEDGDTLTSDITLQDKMLMNQEYILKIQVTTGGRNIYYYTHVVLKDGLHTDDYLNFAAGFWDKCINKTDLDTIGQAVEPDDTTDQEGSLAHMDIHDSVSQLTWGNLNPQIYYKPTPRLVEINENTATLTMDYRISSLSDDGAMRLYNVHEYYRLRYTDSRVYLLNFDRTTDQIFDPSASDALTQEGINLGVTGKSVEYKADEKMRCIAFVQENVLWTYIPAKRTFTRVFGFPQDENMDARDFYRENTIRILRVDGDGNVVFAVGGYMNRGTHEGDNGIGVCAYDSGSGMVSELAFLQSDENTERIQLDMQECLYLTQDGGSLYCLLGGTIYHADLKTQTSETVSDEVRNQCYAGSDSGRYFAWLKEGSVYASRTLEVMDFETGKTAEYVCGDDEYLRPLCFMKENVVYGVAKASDTDTSHGGGSLFPMFSLRIADGSGNTVKTYEPDGLYVTAASLTGNMLSLTRVSRTADGFEEAPDDQIVSSDTAADVELGVATKTDSTRQTLVFLRTGSTVTNTGTNLITAKLLSGASHLIRIAACPETEDLYFVYASGGLTAIYTYPNEAIMAADELLGVVIDRQQNYVWVRGDRDTKAEIRIDDVPTAMKSGTTDIPALQSGIGKTVVDLYGCSLDEVLYFVSHGKPVMVQTPEGTKIIVGYDEYNTYLCSPGDTEWYYYGLNDSESLFGQGGNSFVSYLDTDAG